MRRVGQFLSLLLLLTAVVLWIAQSSNAGPRANEVTIRTVDDGPKTVSLDDIGVMDKQKYKVRDADGNKYYVTINNQRPGYTLASIYNAAGVDYEDVDFVEIARPDGGFVRLYGKQLGPNYFDHGPVAIYRNNPNSDVLNFIRPLADGVKNDVNAPDNFQLNGPLTIRDRSGRPLDVEVTATPTKPHAGESVSFTATVSNGEGYSLNYDWSFSDGVKSDTDAATVTHTFDTPETGVFGVVTVSTEADQSKGEGSIALNVGKEEPEEDTSSTGGYSGYDGYSGYSGYDGYSTPSYTDPGTDYNTPDSTNKTPTDTPKPEDEADPTQTEPTGTPVEGELLQDAAVVPEGTSAPPLDSNTPPEPTTPVPTVEKERDVPTSVVTGMAVIGLLGLGTFTELGGAGSGTGRRRRLMPFGRGKK